MEAILLKKKLYSYVTALLLAVTALLFYPSQSQALSGNEASYFLIGCKVENQVISLRLMVVGQAIKDQLLDLVL